MSEDCFQRDDQLNPDQTRIVSAVCDGHASDKDRNALEVAMSDDPELRQAVGVYLLMHGELRRQMRGSSPQDSVETSEATATVDVLPKIEVESTSLSPRIKRWDSIHWQRHKVRFNAMTAVLTALGWIAFSYFVMVTTTPDDSRPRGDGINVNFVARITGRYEHRWAEGMHGMPPNAFLVPGERLNLVEGLIEITFFDGAIVVLEGPGEFVIDSPGTGTLGKGKLVGRVPPSAKGLQITTADAVITDLGTEFGVAISEGETDVQCLAGEIVVEMLGGETRRLTLGVGERATLGSDGTVRRGSAARDAPAFVRSIPDRQSGRFTILPWTGDEDSLINTDKTYTHLVDFAPAVDQGAVVNGVQFTPFVVVGSPPGLTEGLVSGVDSSSGNEWSVRGFRKGLYWANRPVSLASESGSRRLVDTILFIGDECIISLDNLETEQEYILALYGAPWEAEIYPQRQARIAGSEGGIVTWDQQLAADLLQYRYRASSSRVVLYIRDLQPHNYWHLYAFSNELVEGGQ